MKYIYSAVFRESDDSTKIYARIPDLPGCITTSNSLMDAIAMITDAASGWLVVAEDEGIPIPPPSAQDSLPHSHGDIFSMIQVDTIAYRSETETRSVRKNVSLPAWMANMADKRGLNCSKLLQDAIRVHLT